MDHLTALLLDGKRIEVELPGGFLEQGIARPFGAAPIAYCLHYEPLDGRPLTVVHERFVQLVPDISPETVTLKTDMTAVWEQLPVEVRALFRPLKTAILDAINDNCLDEVRLLIAGAEVPADYEPAKAQLLALLIPA